MYPRPLFPKKEPDPPLQRPQEDLVDIVLDEADGGPGRAAEAAAVHCRRQRQPPRAVTAADTGRVRSWPHRVRSGSNRDRPPVGGSQAIVGPLSEQERHDHTGHDRDGRADDQSEPGPLQTPRRLW